MTFDPNAAAAPDSGIFGLPFTRENADLVLVPVPFDATTSYGGGASAGPAAILEASRQVDLLDHHFGNIYERGIAMLEIPDTIAELSRTARDLAAPIIEAGGAAPGDRAAVQRVDDACRACNEYTHDEFTRILRDGKVPGLIGGDHSTPYGAIRACVEHLEHLARHGGEAGRGATGGVGILHLDAHLDLRKHFEGFHFSHASIMRNVLDDMPMVTKLVSVGIRDYCEEECEYAEHHPERVSVKYDYDLSQLVWAGTTWPQVVAMIVRELPRNVYVSFDIDAFDPSLCPHTGTPVPGGLSFNQACAVLAGLADSGRRVVGFDLNEVCPGPDPAEPAWDANVGARVLYKLCGAALATNPRQSK